MFRVDYRFAGSGAWTTSGAPMTVQTAWGQARAMSTPQRADQVRVVPTGPSLRLLDLKA